MIEFAVFIFGLLIGSFLNVCIYRIPKGETVVTTPSHCMHCGRPIRWFDLVPVFSYLLLKGKCRHCGAGISFRYPVVELLNGFLFLGAYLVFGISYETAVAALLASALIVVALIDYDHGIIPDGVVVFIFVLAAAGSIVIKEPSLAERIIGLFAASLPLYLIALLSKGGMGGGDIKLMAAAGVFLGWKLVLLSVLLGSVSGAVTGIVMMLLKKADRKTAIPFGPFLAFGVLLSAYFGDGLILWYLNLW